MESLITLIARLIDNAVWSCAAALGVALGIGVVASCGEQLRRYARRGLVFCGLGVCALLFCGKPPAGSTNGMDHVSSPLMEEYAEGTNPRSRDSDDDGLEDAEEVGRIVPTVSLPDFAAAAGDSVIYVCTPPVGHVDSGAYPFDLPFPVRLSGRICTRGVADVRSVDFDDWTWIEYGFGMPFPEGVTVTASVGDTSQSRSEQWRLVLSDLSEGGRHYVVACALLGLSDDMFGAYDNSYGKTFEIYTAKTQISQSNMCAPIGQDVRIPFSLTADTDPLANWSIEPVLPDGARLFVGAFGGTGAATLDGQAGVWGSIGSVPATYTITARHPNFPGLVSSVTFSACRFKVESVRFNFDLAGATTDAVSLRSNYSTVGVAVPFENGVLDWATFTSTRVIETKVAKGTTTFNWYLCRVGELPCPSMQIGTTGPHRIYTVLAPPVEPWSADIASDQCAWTNALEWACVHAFGATTQNEAASRIAEAINSSGKFIYAQGDARYCHEVAWTGSCGDSDFVYDACLRVDGDDSPSVPPHHWRSRIF